MLIVIMPGGIGLANPQFPYKSYFDPIGEAAPSSYTYDVTTKNQFALRSFKDDDGNCFTDMVLMSDGTNSTPTFRLFTNTPEGNAIERMTIPSNGNVGIGTSNPLQKTHIYDSDYAYLMITGQANRAGIILSEDNNNNFILEYDGRGTGAGNYVAFYSEGNGWAQLGEGLNYVPSNGRVGIRTTSPSAPLHVVSPASGSAQDRTAIFGNDGTGTTGDYDTVVSIEATAKGETVLSFKGGQSDDIWTFNCGSAAASIGVYETTASNYNDGTSRAYLTRGTNGWQSGSDERLKNITGPITEPFEKINQIRTVMYTLKDDEMNRERPGILAQDIQQIFPDIVGNFKQKRDDGTSETYLGLAYQELVPLCLAAIKEQQAFIENLKARIEALENRV